MVNKHNYLPSIDSLRAIAVISVIIYHANANFLPGGFLGVDLFFVLSGYLISSLIIKEYKETNKLDLWNFYVRRARRLLPAVYFMITIVLIIMVIFNKYLLEKSYLDSLFGYIYTSNWGYIFHKLDYFDSFGSISPFKHLWSLAIEEQFYLIFPLIFLVVNFKSKGKELNKYFNYVVYALIFISFIVHIFLFDITNVNRVYYGTDTRAFALLVGVVGALFYPISKMSIKASEKISKQFSLISVIGIIIFVTLMFFITEYSKFLYYGGFLLFSILFLIIIITSGQQGTYTSMALSFKPLVFIGKISYSLYLWHFPILVFTTPVSEINNSNLFFNVLRLILVFIVAYASYKFVEMPIRKVGFINYIQAIIKKVLKLPLKFRRYIFVFLATIFILFVMGIFGKSVPYISTAFVNNYESNKTTEFVANQENVTSNDDNNDNNSNEQTYNTNLKYEDKTYNEILVIGDSLSVDIGQEILNIFPGSVIDAKVSRQVFEAIPVANNYANFNNSQTAVIFLLGTNGLFTEQQFDDLLKPFNKSDIYFVNTRVPRNWEKLVNEILENNKHKYPNLTIIDWYKASENQPTYFAPDQVHLEDEGKMALTNLIVSSLKHNVETEEMTAIKKQEEEKRKLEQQQSQENNNG